MFEQVSSGSAQIPIDRYMLCGGGKTPERYTLSGISFYYVVAGGAEAAVTAAFRASACA